MKILISIVEIPTTNFSRAKDFYGKVLDIKIEEVEFGGMKLGIFPGSEGTPTVQLIHADGYQPSADGTVVYLNGGSDLQKVLDKVESRGGTTVIPKTGIGPDMGFYAVFTDTEGNKLGLHSME